MEVVEGHMNNHSTIEVAREIETIFQAEAARLTAAGVEAHAHLMPGEFQTSIGLAVFGHQEDAEFSIDLLTTDVGVEIDAALIGGTGHTLSRFGPMVAPTKATLRKEALRLAAIGSQLLMDRFAVAPAR